MTFDASMAQNQRLVYVFEPDEAEAVQAYLKDQIQAQVAPQAEEEQAALKKDDQVTYNGKQYRVVAYNVDHPWKSFSKIGMTQEPQVALEELGNGQLGKVEHYALNLFDGQYELMSTSKVALERTLVVANPDDTEGTQVGTADVDNVTFVASISQMWRELGSQSYQQLYVWKVGDWDMDDLQRLRQDFPDLNFQIFLLNQIFDGLELQEDFEIDYHGPQPVDPSTQVVSIHEEIQVTIFDAAGRIKKKAAFHGTLQDFKAWLTHWHLEETSDLLIDKIAYSDARNAVEIHLNA